MVHETLGVIFYSSSFIKYLAAVSRECRFPRQYETGRCSTRKTFVFEVKTICRHVINQNFTMVANSLS